MTIKRISSALFSGLCLLSFLCTQAVSSDLNPKAIAPDLFVLSGVSGMGNVAFLITSAGVILVDSGDSVYRGSEILAAIGRLTDQPVRYLILTHSHGDHTFGLGAFGTETTLIAQQNFLNNVLRNRQNLERRSKTIQEEIDFFYKQLKKLSEKKIKERKEIEEKLQALEYRLQSQSAVRFVDPQIIFEQGKLSIQLGGQSVEVIYPGPAHINDNLLVWFPKQKVLHTGDIVFARNHPVIDFDGGCDTQNWIQILRGLLQLPVEKVIPGHGAPGGKELLLQQADYLEDLRALVKSGLESGCGLDELKKQINVDRWKDFGYRHLLPSAIEAIYKELQRK